MLAAATLGGWAFPVGAGDRTLEPRKPWVEARTDSFLVLGEVPQRVATRAALDLERFRHLLRRLDGRPADAPVEPFVVVLFGSSKSFARYSPFQRTRGIGGYLLTSSARPYLVVDASDADTLSATLFHEYVHADLDQHSARPPLWYDEGLAELFSTLHLKDDVAQVGRPSTEHVSLLRSTRWLPLEEVLTATTDSELYDATLEGQLFYAQAWALVHYLSTSSETSQRLGSLLAVLQQGVEPEDALREALGIGPRRLERDLHRHVASPRFVTAEVSVPEPETLSLTERQLPDAETLARLGALVAAQGSHDHALTRRLFEAALRLDPTQHLARRGLQRLEAQR